MFCRSKYEPDHGSTHLVVVYYSRYETGVPISWVLRVRCIAKIQHKKITNTGGILHKDRVLCVYL